MLGRFLRRHEDPEESVIDFGPELREFEVLKSKNRQLLEMAMKETEGKAE